MSIPFCGARPKRAHLRAHGGVDSNCPREATFLTPLTADEVFKPRSLLPPLIETYIFMLMDSDTSLSLTLGKAWCLALAMEY